MSSSSLPSANTPPTRTRTADEFWASVDKRGDNECWPASQTVITYEGRSWAPHRLAYQLAHPEVAKVPRLHHLGPFQRTVGPQPLSCCNPLHYVPYETGKHNRPAPLVDK